MFYVHSSDNAKIAVYDLNPTASRTILMLHGWPLSHKMFEYQTPALLEAGYRVVTLDLRGFGNSDETAEGYSYNQLAEDVYYVVRALRLTDFALLGFSMGGAIAVRYMSRYEGYGVNRLILLDAAVPSYCQTKRNPYGQTVESTDQLITLGYNDRPALNEYFGSIFFAQKHSTPFMNWVQRISDGASGTGEMKCLISLRNEDLFDELRYIKVPTAIIHGRDDKICPFGMAKITQEQIRGSKLYPLDNGGHGAFYDDRDKCNQALISFLQS